MKSTLLHKMSKPLLLFALVMLLISCVKTRPSVKAACAVNMINIFPVLVEEFESRHSGITVEVTYGSSGTLSTQIMNGADVDIFLSANQEFPQKLYEKGLTANAPEVYATGRLVLFSRHGLPKEVDLVEFLCGKKIAVANAELAPYGKASIEVLESIGIDPDSVELITARNINQCAQYTLFGTDAGFLSASILFSEAFSSFVHKREQYVHDIEPELHGRVTQAMILLQNADGNHDAKVFYDYILSDGVKALLKKNGYN